MSAPAAPCPAPAPTTALDARAWSGASTPLLSGRWRWDWRFGKELAGSGEISFVDGGFLVAGRTSRPVRGLAWKLIAILLALTELALWVASLLTAIGAAANAKEPGTAFVLVLGVGLLASSVLVAIMWAIVRNVLLPRGRWIVPWTAIRQLATDGRFIELGFDTGQGVLRGRLPLGRVVSEEVKALVAALRRGEAPVGVPAAALQPMRSRWFDRAINLGVLAGAAAAVAAAVPHVEAWWQAAREPSGPAGGIPAAMTALQVEALAPTGCRDTTDAPSVRNARDGTDLVWTASGPPEGYAVVHFAWRAGSTRLRPIGGPLAVVDGRSPGALASEHALALSVVTPSHHAEAVSALLVATGLGGLRGAACSGLVARYDVTTPHVAEGAPALQGRRTDDDLVISIDDVATPARWLTVRRRRLPGLPSSFSVCEVPVHAGSLGSARVVPGASRRFQGFFDGGDEGATVLVVPEANWTAADVLAREGAAVPCLAVEALAHAGVASHRVDILPEVAPEREEAARRARRVPFPTHLTPDAWGRYVQALAHAGLHPDATGLTPADSDAVRAGLLDAIPWSDLLDDVSMGHHLTRLDALRGQLDEVDPDRQLGRAFLIALTERFVERVPLPPGLVGARIDLGEKWLTAGQVSVAGPGVVHDGASARARKTYTLIGRFLLLDAARRLEDHLNRESGLVEWVEAQPAIARLTAHGIAIDVQESTRLKLLKHWVKGDFAYIIDRVGKRVREAMVDEVALASRYAHANIHLETLGGVPPDVRFSRLVVDGRPMGSVLQTDPRRVRTRYDVRDRHSAIRPHDAAVAWTAATYFNKDSEPVGLAIVDGQVENDLIAPKMDGLVLLPPAGPPSMIDMRRGGLLPGATRPIRPLRSLGDFGTLLAWLDDHDASAFQTHLLMADGTARIDPARADATARERRMLAVAAYQGHPIVALVDLPSRYRSHSLYEAAALVEATLEAPAPGGPGLTVRSVANLDTGSQDVFQVRTPAGQVLERGPHDLAQAVNLVSFVL